MNHNRIVHFFIKHYPTTLQHVVDMTAGNGHDSQFLAENVEHVSSIDIQTIAIENTQKRCADYTNIDYYHMSHDVALDLISKPIDGAVYNLGYLPSGDKSVITEKSSTINSLDKLFTRDCAFMCIACYIGHDGGLQEQMAVKAYLDNKKVPYHTIKYDKELSPITYIVDLKNPSSSTIHVDALRHLPQMQLEKALLSKFWDL